MKPPHSCTMHLETVESFIYPTDAQLNCSKNVKIYMRGAPTCFGFSQPSSGSYYMCFAKVISINYQLKYVVLQNLFGLVAAYLSSPYWCVCSVLCRVRQSYSAHYTIHTHTPIRTG
jgi:hypothetical protein